MSKHRHEWNRHTTNTKHQCNCGASKSDKGVPIKRCSDCGCDLTIKNNQIICTNPFCEKGE